MKQVYFETSALNYLIDNISHDSLLGTRDYQRKKGFELILSPVTLWEILLTKDMLVADELVFYAQQVFTGNLLASPSEILVRYLINAYPENKTNYQIYSDSNLAKVWSDLAKDTSKNFDYSFDEVSSGAKFLRLFSKNIKYLVTKERDDSKLEMLKRLKHIIYTCFETMKEDGFLDERAANNDFDEEIYHKIGILFVLLLLVFRADIVRETDLEEFWEKSPVDSSDPTKQLVFIFENYPQLFYIGPIAEMTVMAYHQVHLEKTNRGLIFDCYHTLYAPYVHCIMTADQGFSELGSKIEHYSKRILNISESGLREVIDFEEV